MEALVQDLNSALEESTASSSHKRKSWKRRKKKNEDSFDSDSSSLSSSSGGKAPSIPRGRRRRSRHDQESGDSFNESKAHQPRPKRKRKCKRGNNHESIKQQSQKRKKIRTISSEMKCIRPGKRPRSTSSPMDLDEDDSSSSCEEDEELEDEEEEELFDNEYDDRGQEADDEQSDWPGGNEDDEILGIRRLLSSKADNRREIRSGTRKNPHVKEELMILNHQMTSFLRDASRIDLKLNVRLSTERNKIVQFANLYSLNLKVEGLQRIRLTKTCNTLQLNNKDGLFLIPSTPSSSALEFKRRRKTPPLLEAPSPLSDVKSPLPPPRDSQSPASKRRSNYYEGSRSS